MVTVFLRHRSISKFSHSRREKCRSAKVYESLLEIALKIAKIGRHSASATSNQINKHDERSRRRSSRENWTRPIER